MCPFSSPKKKLEERENKYFRIMQKVLEFVASSVRVCCVNFLFKLRPRVFARVWGKFRVGYGLAWGWLRIGFG